MLQSRESFSAWLCQEFRQIASTQGHRAAANVIKSYGGTLEEALALLGLRPHDTTNDAPAR